MSKSLVLRQKVYSLHVTESTGFYQINGKTYIFWVECNTNWKIKSVTEEVTSGSGNLLSPKAGDNLNTDTGGGAGKTVIRFTVSNDMTLRGSINVVFGSTDNPKHFDEVTLVLSMNEYYPKSHNGWAGSNIYWSNGKLTFDDVGVTTHQNYQGLFFKWGSLWGIAPNGTNMNPWNASNSVYRLNGGAYSIITNYNYSEIPYASGLSVSSNPPWGKTERDSAYLYEITDGAANIGDICKYMTDKRWTPGPPGTKWRMPTSNEFETAGSYSKSGAWIEMMSNSPSGAYTNTYTPGYRKSDIGNPFFPTAGSRESTMGAPTGLGTMGYYWSSSIGQNYIYFLNFGNNNFESNSRQLNERAFAYPVRCVRE